MVSEEMEYVEMTIRIIGLNVGQEAMNMFHSYYGELFIAWVLVYSVMIIYSRKIWTKLSIIGEKLAEIGRKSFSHHDFGYAMASRNSIRALNHGNINYDRQELLKIQ